MNFTDVMGNAEQYLLKHGEHPHTVLAQFENIPVVKRVIRSFPRVEEQRQHTLFLEGKCLSQQYPTSMLKTMFFIYEAWVSFFDAQHGYHVPPSSDPKRREALVVVELNAETLLQTGELREMRRNAKKKLTSLRPFPQILHHDAIVGPLALSWLAGFAESAERFPARRALHAKILQEHVTIDHLIEKRDPPF